MGIPADTIPVTEDGEVLLDTHKAWLQYRIHEEAAVVEVEDDMEEEESNYVDDDDDEEDEDEDDDTSPRVSGTTDIDNNDDTEYSCEGSESMMQD
jgi:hypothetical protein